MLSNKMMKIIKLAIQHDEGWYPFSKYDMDVMSLPSTLIAIHCDDEEAVDEKPWEKV